MLDLWGLFGGVSDFGGVASMDETSSMSLGKVLDVLSDF